MVYGVNKILGAPISELHKDSTANSNMKWCVPVVERFRRLVTLGCNGTSIYRRASGAKNKHDLMGITRL